MSDLATVMYVDDPSIVAPKSRLEAVLTKPEESIAIDLFIVGRNVQHHDAKHQLVSRREVRAKKDVAIDTLLLNPLAFR